MKYLLILILLPLVAKADLSLQQELETRALHYFIDEANPKTGLVRDKASNFETYEPHNRVASLAATGFGLAILANAAKRGLLERHWAYQRILLTLRFTRDHVPKRKGFLLHWVNWETGERIWQSEYSPIDSALFIAGALYAAQIFPHTELAHIANTLYEQMDFHDYLTDGGKKPRKKTLSLSYSPEKGFEPYQWNVFAEQKILLLLGIGHPKKPLPLETWKNWHRFHSLSALSSGIMGHHMPLFVHQYSYLFFDFRNFKDGHSNYFHNSVRATEVHRRMRKTSRERTFKEGFWGVSAGADPEGYKVYGPTDHRGTVCVGCALGSAMFTGPVILNDAEAWRNGPYGPQVWGRYGFVDSLDLERNWFAKSVIGITVGPIYMSLANMKAEHSFWQDFMQIPAMKMAMKKVGGAR